MKLARAAALVTGGAVRIGKAICEALAQRGCAVVIHCDRSRRQAESLALHLQGLGARASVVQGHLESEADCGRVVEAARKAAGQRLNVLVNNAAVFHKNSLAGSAEPVLMAELRTNALVPFFLTRAFAAGIPEGGRGIRGKVINLLDRRVAGVERGCLPYLLSKKMLADLTRIAALELAPRVTVNGVAPGAVLAPPGARGVRVRDLAGYTPLKRRCTPQDVAAAVVFLLECDAVTGDTLYVDGGQHLGNGECRMPKAE